MMSPINYYKYIEMLKSKSFEELVKMRQDLLTSTLKSEKIILESLENEKQYPHTSTVFDANYSENNKMIALITDEINKKHDVIQSGFGEEELYVDEQKEIICPRCKFPSTKYRLCPKCGFLKLLSCYGTNNDGNTIDNYYDKLSKEDTEYFQSKEDEYLEQAIILSIKRTKTSASFLQRALSIGYSRASRLIDKMEDLEIIEPNQQGTKERKILISKEDYLKNKIN